MCILMATVNAGYRALWPAGSTLLFTGRMPRSRKLPVLFLLTGQKSAYSPPQERLAALIHAKFDTTKGHVGPLGHTKFHANWFTGW